MITLRHVSQIGPDAMTKNDCGPACVSCLLEAYFGRAFPPDSLYQYLPPEVRGHYTSLTQLTSLLGEFELPSRIVEDDDATLGWQFETLVHRMPLIALVNYAILKASYNPHCLFNGAHIIVVVGMSDTEVWIHDPLMADGPTAIPIKNYTEAHERTPGNNGVRLTIAPNVALPLLPGQRPVQQSQVTATNGLWVRTGPGQDYQKLRKLPYGSRVHVEKYQETHSRSYPRWAFLPDENGWCAAYYLKEP